jgi:signal transduction histidine kinase
MFHVIGCIIEQHDLRLVALAGILCLLACFTASSMILRGRAAEGNARALWLLAAGLVFGSGIWATHFVGMLAYQAGLPVAFDANLTLLSIAVAISLSTVGFWLALGRAGAIAGGALVGAAISAMHYIGMAAVRIAAFPIWNLGYIEASVVIGIGVSALALHIVLRGSGRALVAGSVFFTLAIVFMHFTGMSAVSFSPDPGVVVPNVFMEPASLAVAVSAVAILIVALGLAGAMVDYHLAKRATGEAERLRAHIAELESTKRTLEATSGDLSRALAAAAAANETKAQFLASMSHELRTPLNAIIGFSEFLTMEAYGPIGNVRYKEYVQDIRDSGAHLLSLINDILDLSRLDAGQTELKEEVLALGDLIAETLRMVRPQAEAGGVVLSESVEPGLPRIFADHRRILQVLINLAANAIKFTPAKGNVDVSAFRRGGEICLAVSDTGIGIAEADIPKALERFGQIDSSVARKFQGAGLGLPLAKQLTELHGGRLELASKPNCGTTVTVIFPAARSVELARNVA